MHIHSRSLSSGTYSNKSVRLRTSADNVTLLAVAAEHRASVCRATGHPAAAAVDRYVLLDGPTAANPLQRHAAVDGCDRQTDIHPTVIYTLLRMLCEQRQQLAISRKLYKIDV